MKTFNEFLEQVGHVPQTSAQQTDARRLAQFKRSRHYAMTKRGITTSSAYDKEKQHNIKDIEDRRS